MYLASMARKAVAIELTPEERGTLGEWIRSRRTEQDLGLRARIILMAAEGMQNQDIADGLKTTEVTVGKWRTRFAEKRMAGLQDEPRPGAKRVYTEETERRILKKLDEPPPPGHATWSGPLVAQALGDVSDDQVWRVLRRRGIHLQRRRS